MQIPINRLLFSNLTATPAISFFLPAPRPNSAVWTASPEIHAQSRFHRPPKFETHTHTHTHTHRCNAPYPLTAQSIQG